MDARKQQNFDVEGGAPHGGIGTAPPKDFDEEADLPITANRSAKWWYVAVHNVTAMVGAGVLGLPYAMALLGWTGGVIVLVLAYLISVWTLWQLCYMHEIDGRRMNRYHELGQYAFGKTAGLWAIVPFQLIVMIGLDIVYMVTGGSSLQQFYILCGGTASFGLSAWIVVFAATELISCQLPNFNALFIVSLVAAVTSISYSTIGWVSAVADGKTADVSYAIKGDGTHKLMGIFNALGTCVFAYGGHSVVLEIQATLPSKPGIKNSTFKPYMWGVALAYAAIAYCYFCVAFAGYWAFGNSVKSNIMLSVAHPTWLVAVANMLVVVHVFGSYQMYAMPVFDMVEDLSRRKGIKSRFFTRVVMRSVFVVFTAFIGITLPFFGDLLGFFGAFGFAPMTFWMPSVIWLVVMKPKRNSFDFWANVINIIVFVAVMFLAAIGSIYSIVQSASNYKFYQ
ncbi:hypothetical protein ABBQ38_003657 [Trebouxia sp. C0009 RCD-2024]